jgi:predicted transcriptional regulator
MALNKTPVAKPLPDDALAAMNELKAHYTQSDIARRLGVSEGTISNALKGRYIGNVDALAERIRGELLNQTVACPILGEITTRICQDERKKPFHTANPMRVQLWRACKTCPHNPATKGEPL